ncbi:hypothetical protein CYMTET_34517, partial [Cymbomonas tetramitiformis]
VADAREKMRQQMPVQELTGKPSEAEASNAAAWLGALRRRLNPSGGSLHRGATREEDSDPDSAEARAEPAGAQQAGLKEGEWEGALREVDDALLAPVQELVAHGGGTRTSHVRCREVAATLEQVVRAVTEATQEHYITSTEYRHLLGGLAEARRRRRELEVELEAAMGGSHQERLRCKEIHEDLLMVDERIMVANREMMAALDRCRAQGALQHLPPPGGANPSLRLAEDVATEVQAQGAVWVAEYNTSGQAVGEGLSRLLEDRKQREKVYWMSEEGFQAQVAEYEGYLAEGGGQAEEAAVALQILVAEELQREADLRARRHSHYQACQHFMLETAICEAINGEEGELVDQMEASEARYKQSAAAVQAADAGSCKLTAKGRVSRQVAPPPLVFATVPPPGFP